MTPRPHDPKDVDNFFQQWHALAAEKESALAGWMKKTEERKHPYYPLLVNLSGNSPYLSRLLLLYPQVLFDSDTMGFDAVWQQLMQELAGPHPLSQSHKELMRDLRLIKGKAALLIACADTGGTWALTQVTAALTQLAERSLFLALDSLLADAHRRGHIELANLIHPSEGSGIIVLGMGKLGGCELNYSSDIDLIILFEPGRLRIKGRASEQKFMTKLCHDLVAIMQERTPQGYVFRTDLRLRPDPASTPPAISTDAAYYYYESVGQNWERAAMIKARPVAGDIAAGERFLKGIAPFMWRRNLDFAAIADIHSIKRQMDSHQSKDITVKGHNIKLGQGGIREIEFFVQIHQLIWGGREPILRSRSTCEMLLRLREYGLVDGNKETVLQEAYQYLRTLEHRLQMVADAQTHNLPDTDDGMAHIACFMGYENRQAFESDLLKHLHAVHAIYASSFRSDQDQDLGDHGNLVFTGVSHDPETLETLRAMGYAHAETVSEIVMGWHHGSCRATRSKRARELLTEMMPVLLKRLSETAHPDTAFLKFNEFLTNLPSGVQLFSLFNMNPDLLGLIADIMGSAPKLADHLSKSPELLDAVLYDDFYAELPTPDTLARQLDQYLKEVSSPDTGMERIRYFRNEKKFQAGVHMLRGMINAETTGPFLSSLADITIRKAFAITGNNFCQVYGSITGSHLATIALGKLGSRELTFNSDIDLIFVYDAPNPEQMSDGGKGFSAPVYYNRLAQRLVGALTAMGRAGRLYEVDTRLRPSGEQGFLAVSVEAFTQYFDTIAWTFESMALTKARVISAPAPLKEKLEQIIHRQLAKARDADTLKRDVIDMRERIAKQHNDADIWDIKYVRGGLTDMDFLAQYLLLLHAHHTPGAIPQSAVDIFHWLADNGQIPLVTAEELVVANQFLSNIFNVLRLCNDSRFHEASAPEGLKKLLVQSVGGKDFESTRLQLIQVEQSVFAQYISYLTV